MLIKREIKSIAPFFAFAFFILLMFSPADISFSSVNTDTDIASGKILPWENRQRNTPAADIEMNATVSPKEGVLNLTLFNFTLSVPSTINVSGVLLRIGNATTLEMKNNWRSENRTIYWQDRYISSLSPGSYNFSFLLNTSNGTVDHTRENYSFTIRPPLVNITVEPSSGSEDERFVFSVTYRNPSGEAPLNVVAVIGNTTNRGMIPTTIPFNYSKGVSFVNDSLLRDLGPGPHSYYPVVSVGDRYYSARDEYVTFNITGDKKGGGGDDKWYDDECCLIPLVFFIFLFIFSMINNIIMRRRVKNRRSGSRNVPPPGSGGRGRNRCSNCNAIVGDEDSFCPKCGETFEDEIELECPKCGYYSVGSEGFCPKCGVTFDRTIEVPRKSDRKKLKEEIRKLSADAGQGPGGNRNISLTVETADADEEFICSMCGAAVRGKAYRCPKCGIEFD